MTSLNTSRTGCGTVLTLFQNLFHYPSNRRPLQNHPVRKNVFGKIVLQLFCCTCHCLQACSSFLFVSEQNSHATPSSLCSQRNSTGLAKLASAESDSHDSVSGSICENLLLSSSSMLTRLVLDRVAAVKSLSCFHLVPQRRTEDPQV